MRGRGRYQNLAETDRPGQGAPGPDDQRREDLKLVEGAAPTLRKAPTPAPAPRPSGELLAYLDPQQAARAAQVEALNDLARTGKIDWLEWRQRVRGLDQEAATTTKQDELAQARAAAAEARLRETAAVRDRENDGQER